MSAFDTLVILDTAWGPAQLPQLFCINTTGNKSGKLLRKLMGTPYILVCNSSSRTVEHARIHGTPDVSYLAGCCYEAFKRFTISTFILGGKVAQSTFDTMREDIHHKTGVDAFGAMRVIRIPHPAARFWTHDMVARATAAIADKSIKDFTLTK